LKNIHVKEHRKQRYQENNDEFKVKSKQRYEENKYKILEYQKQKIECECGCNLTVNHKARHERSKKHLKNMKLKLEPEKQAELIII